MTTETYTQRLAKVRAAIDAILAGGQSVTYEGQQMTFASLATLRDLERDYVAEAAKENHPKKSRNRVIYVKPL